MKEMLGNSARSGKQMVDYCAETFAAALDCMLLLKDF